MRSAVGVFATILFLVTGAVAENWPHWRGPSRDGVSTEKNLPTTWTSSEGITWKIPMAAWSGATPIIWGDRIFLNSAEGGNGWRSVAAGVAEDDKGAGQRPAATRAASGFILLNRKSRTATGSRKQRVVVVVYRPKQRRADLETEHGWGQSAGAQAKHVVSVSGDRRPPCLGHDRNRGAEEL